MTELTPTTFRRARTRSLIQLGGLIEKAGLLDDFGIELGADLQKDPEMKKSVCALLGALLEIKDMMAQENTAIDLWTLKGHKMFGEMKECK